MLAPDIEKYITTLHHDGNPLFREMEAYAEQHQFPIVGPVVGRLLYQWALGIQAQRIFELGSGFGYSALWFAKALRANGEIHCTDRSEANLSRLQEYAKRAGVQDRIRTYCGDALEALQAQSHGFDLIFMDIDKRGYPVAFQRAWPKVRPGGLFIADNALWHGRVVDATPDETTQAVRDFTRLAFTQHDALTTLIPLRDGVLVALKKPL